MKRYVKAASAKYSSEDFKTIAEEVDSTLCDSDAAEAILKADKTGLLETFATDIRIKGDIEFSGNHLSPIDTEHNYPSVWVSYNLKPLRKGQWTDKKESIYFNNPITITRVASKLASEMRKTLNTYYKRYEESLDKQALRDKFNTDTTKMITAFAVACQYVKKYAELRPTFRYSDTGTAQYMLWDLPDVEMKDRMLNEEALTAHEEVFRDALERFEKDTGVELEYVVCPHGGNYVRSCFEFKVNPKIQLVYDKENNTYTIVSK